MDRVPQLLLLLAFFLLAATCSQDAADLNRSIDQNGRAFVPINSKRVDETTTRKLSGTVISITDGDTFTVLADRNRSYVIRMKGIDAPESRQSFSTASRRNLASLVTAKSITIEWQKHDRYGRIVGKVLLNGEDICLRQIRDGLAWHYKQFENEQTDVDRHLYSDAEQRARVQRVGLWQEPYPIAPWDFKNNKGTVRTVPNHQSAPELSSDPGVEESTPRNETIRGNRRSRIYHWPGCPNYDDIAPHNRIPFRSREEAERAGYRPARNCR